MARPKGTNESLGGYFRGVFAKRPEWLVERSNDAILAQYRADHGLAPDATLEPRIASNLSNVKSVLRKQGRKQGKRRVADTMAPVAAAPVTMPVRRGMNGRLESLEEMIDDCLTMAKHQDRQGLHDVIQLLRRARNNVVWKLGQKE
jgi:hypothetical protein